MPLLPAISESPDIERRVSIGYLVAQRSQKRVINAARAQEEALRAGHQLQAVARPYAQLVKHALRKSDLPL